MSRPEQPLQPLPGGPTSAIPREGEPPCEPHRADGSDGASPSPTEAEDLLRRPAGAGDPAADAHATDGGIGEDGGAAATALAVTSLEATTTPDPVPTIAQPIASPDRDATAGLDADATDSFAPGLALKQA
jgi:hypothetical protein